MGSTILNWPKCDRYKDQLWLKNQISNTMIRMAKNSKVFRFPYDRLADEGLDPYETLEMYRELLCSRICSGGWFVTHNGTGFDMPMIRRNFKQFLNKDFWFSRDCMIDTGVVEKAYLTYTFPEANEDLREFNERVYTSWGHGARWSLEDCVTRYGLDKRYSLDTNKAHDAEYDSYATHLLFEEYRRIAGAD